MSYAQEVPLRSWKMVGICLQTFMTIIDLDTSDVLFPSLPRWFTGPLRLRPRRTESVHLPDGSSHRVGSASSAPHTTPSDIPTHDHALLDSLYISVFEHRFVNIKPSGQSLDA